MQFNEINNRKQKNKYRNEEEFKQEQEKRRQRALLNKEFKNFAEKVQNTD